MASPLTYIVAVMAAGVAAQWLAWRLRLPAILLLLGFGFAIGLFAKPGEYIPDELFFPFVSLSVAVVLFEGGMSLRFDELREAGRAVAGLVTTGLIATWVLATGTILLLIDLSLDTAAIAGAILVVSGPTVVGPLLRHIRPARRVGAIAKWEGIVNDPIGAVLAVLVFEAVLSGGFRSAALETTLGLLATLAIGVTFGGLAALFLIRALRRHWVPDHLHSAVLLITVLVSHTASNLLRHESGLVTVTLFGIILANQKRVVIHHLVAFKENLRTLLVSTLFILLGSRVDTEAVRLLGWGGIGLLALSVLVIRPIAVLIGTLGTALDWKSKVFLACLAPRGIVAAAVSSVFALEIAQRARTGRLPAELGAEAELLAPLVFLMIAGTVTIYGLAAGPVARMLRISEPNPKGFLFAGANPLTRMIADALKAEGHDVLLVDTRRHNIAEARLAGLATCHCSILSDFARDHLDLGSMGRLMAMTSNDEVNALAALQFTEVFGRPGVFQLPPHRAAESGPREPMPPHLRGRYLFDEDATYTRLAERVAAGATLKKTGLTEEFGFDDFLRMHGGSALPLFLVDSAKGVIPFTSDRPPTPLAGDSIISLVNPAPTPAQ